MNIFLIINPNEMLYKIMHKILIFNHTDMIFGKLMS